MGITSTGCCTQEELGLVVWSLASEVTTSGDDDDELDGEGSDSSSTISFIEEGNADEGGVGDVWSWIPSLLLSLINEKLDLPNRLRLAAVCKTWNFESSTFPPCKVSMPPWIMVTNNLSSSHREFVSITSLERYTVDSPYFASTFCLASKEGWLLLLMEYPEDSFVCFMYFFNPFTKERIGLPAVYKNFRRERPPLVDFTTKSGYPHRVVFIDLDLEITDNDISPFGVKVMCVNDYDWTKAVFQYWKPVAQHSIVKITLAGSTLYCFSGNACVLLVNVDTLMMEKHDMVAVENQNFEMGKCYFMELQGQFFMVYFKENVVDTPFIIYKLNVGGKNNPYMRWERLKESDYLYGLTYFLDDGPYKLDQEYDITGVSFVLDDLSFRPSVFAIEENSSLVPDKSLLFLEADEDLSFFVSSKYKGAVIRAKNSKSIRQWVQIG